MAPPKTKGGATQGNNNARILFFSVLLALQYGAQPLISKRFISREVIVTSSVLSCEAAKVVFALYFMAKEGSMGRMYKEWTLIGALTASGLPAAIYALQNSLLQISYKNLDSLTFSILNQTKIFFTALFTYFMLRQKQSIQQIGALFLLIAAAVLLSVGEGSNNGSTGANADQVLFYGIIPVLIASVLSGLASSLCQWASQVKKHSSYLMTVEMSIVGSICLLASTLKSPDGEAIRRHGFFHGWTPLTWVMFLSMSFFRDINSLEPLVLLCSCVRSQYNHRSCLENANHTLCAKHLHVHVFWIQSMSIFVLWEGGNSFC